MSGSGCSTSRLRGAWVLAALLATGAGARADHIPGSERYGVEQGLHANEVVDLIEDEGGYLWVASFYGLFRFDGRAFTHFGAAEGLDSELIHRLHVDRAGHLRVGTSAGLFAFDGHRFAPEPRLPDNAQLVVQDILEARDGALWLATRTGVMRLVGDTAQRIGVADGLPWPITRSLAEAPDGAIWIGTGRGLAQWTDRVVATFDSHDIGRDFITRMLFDDHGVLWLATDRGLFYRQGKGFARLDLGAGESDLYVLDLALDRRGRLRIATIGAGVLSWDGARVERVGLDEGLTSLEVWSVRRARSGGLWIGLEDDTVVLRDEVPFELVRSRRQLGGSTATSIARTPGGALWVGTRGAGALLMEPGPAGGARLIGAADGLRSLSVGQVAPALDGGAWIGTGQGIARWNPATGRLEGEWQHPRVPSVEGPVRDLYQGPGGDLWMANVEQGLVHYHGLFGERFPGGAAASPAPLSALTPDGHGGLWLGGKNQILHFENGHALALPLPATRAENWILGLARAPGDAGDKIWFASQHAFGLLDVSAGSRIALWPLPPGTDAIWVTPEPGGGALAADNDHLYHLRQRPDGELELLSTIGPAEGVPRGLAVVQGGPLWEPDGTLLLACNDGLVRYDPRRAEQPEAPPRVHLRELRVLGEAAALPPLAAELVLAHDHDDLAFDFDGTAFPAPDLIEFRYRLDGLGDGWSPPTPERRAIFSRVPPGRYRFRVQARRGGAWGSEASSGTIRINPPWWSSAWFTALALASLLGAATVVPLMRNRELRRQRDRLERLVLERTGELAEQRDQLELQVATRTEELRAAYQNLLAETSERERIGAALEAARRAASLGRLAGVVAHQVNTPLAAMKTRIGLLREDLAALPEAGESLDVMARQVDRIAATMRALLGYVRQRALDDESPRIEALVGAVTRLYVEVLREKGVTLDARIAADLPPVRGSADDLQELLLNLIENAREAVPAGGTVRVTAERADDVVRLCVEDDGPGLGDDPERLFQPFFTTKTTGTGLGLAIARRIAAAAGGTITGETRAEGGARFVITLPIAPNRAGDTAPAAASPSALWS